MGGAADISPKESAYYIVINLCTGIELAHKRISRRLLLEGLGEVISQIRLDEDSEIWRYDADHTARAHYAVALSKHLESLPATEVLDHMSAVDKLDRRIRVWKAASDVDMDDTSWKAGYLTTPEDL
jgi:hypothetical protein